MANLIVELWLEIRGHRNPPPPLRGKAPDWAGNEEPDIVALDGRFLDSGDDAPVDHDLEEIAGTCVEIVYCDAKGRVAGRRITCRSFFEAKDIFYLDAYCHERRATRRFRCDRIQEVIDQETGELWAGDEFLAEYHADHRASAMVSMGMSPRDYGRFLNALRALVFMSRCDADWHPLEMEEIENFIASYWMRTERSGEPPMADLVRKVRRMSPQPEEFFVALQSVATDAKLARMVQNGLRAIIAADGRIAAEETFWGQKVDAFLSA